MKCAVFVSTVVMSLLMVSISGAVPYSEAPAIAACQKSGPTGVAGFDWTGIVNTSTAENMYIDCGDSYNWESSVSAGGIYVWNVMAWVWDRSTTANVGCSMKVIDALGDVWYSGASKSTSGSDNSFAKLLEWDSIGQYGNAYVSCSIPKASGSSYSGVSALTVQHDF